MQFFVLQCRTDDKEACIPRRVGIGVDLVDQLAFSTHFAGETRRITLAQQDGHDVDRDQIFSPDGRPFEANCKMTFFDVICENPRTGTLLLGFFWPFLQRNRFAAGAAKRALDFFQRFRFFKIPHRHDAETVRAVMGLVKL